MKIRCLIGMLVLTAVAQQNAGVTSPCPAGITAIGNCPTGGCGHLSDSLLDEQKNRTEAAQTSGAAKRVADIKALPEPKDWLTGKNRAEIEKPGLERSPFRLVAFLQKVKTEGGESCNCELRKLVDTDLHFVMVDDLNDPESASISAEVTPRVRQNGHENWTDRRLKPLEGSLVRLTGWLMLDTAHIHHNVLLHDAQGPEINREPINRASNWELHPITKIEVCKGPTQACRSGQGWQDF